MQKIDRTGEENINKQGLKMQIIRYKNVHDIDIQFEDGIIVRHTYYQYFKKGNIINYNIPTYLGVIEVMALLKLKLVFLIQKNIQNGDLC